MTPREQLDRLDDEDLLASTLKSQLDVINAARRHNVKRTERALAAGDTEAPEEEYVVLRKTLLAVGFIYALRGITR